MTLWSDVVSVLRDFQAAVKEVKASDPNTPEGLAVLNEYLFLPNALAVSTSKAFVAWVEIAFSPGTIDNIDAFRPQGKLLKEVIETGKGFQELLSKLNAYQDTIQKYLEQVGPQRFEYKGFKIDNELRLSDEKLGNVLDAIDFLIALFKKRGVEDLLYEGLREITIEDLKENAGEYRSSTRTIALGPHALTQRPYRLFTGPWTQGTFLHEFGHYVHMTYVKGEARAFWNQTWDPIKEVKKNMEQVSSEEIQRFYGLLEKDGFVPIKTAKKLKGMDKVKFAYWLRHPMLGDPLITPGQFRLTRHGEAVFRVLRDPLTYVREESNIIGMSEEENVKRIVKHKREDVLGVGYSGGLGIYPKDLEEIRKADPSIEQALEQSYQALGVPSEYGRTNELEDFADTFVVFLVSPEKLSENALYRMKHTLWLSGFGGKPVMRLAHRVAIRWLQRHSRHQAELYFQAFC